VTPGLARIGGGLTQGLHACPVYAEHQGGGAGRPRPGQGLAQGVDLHGPVHVTEEGPPLALVLGLDLEAHLHGVQAVLASHQVDLTGHGPDLVESRMPQGEGHLAGRQALDAGHGGPLRPSGRPADLQGQVQAGLIRGIDHDHRPDRIDFLSNRQIGQRVVPGVQEPWGRIQDRDLDPSAAPPGPLHEQVVGPGSEPDRKIGHIEVGLPGLDLVLGGIPAPHPGFAVDIQHGRAQDVQQGGPRPVRPERQMEIPGLPPLLEPPRVIGLYSLPCAVPPVRTGHGLAGLGYSPSTVEDVRHDRIRVHGLGSVLADPIQEQALLEDHGLLDRLVQGPAPCTGHTETTEAEGHPIRRGPTSLRTGLVDLHGVHTLLTQDGPRPREAGPTHARQDLRSLTKASIARSVVFHEHIRRAPPRPMKV